MSSEDNNKGSQFTSAMGDLKGLLDKEGINVKSADDPVKKSIANSDIDTGDELIPTLKIVDIDNTEQHDSSNQEVDIPYINNEISPVNLPTLPGTITVVDESEPGFVPIDDYLAAPLVIEVDSGSLLTEGSLSAEDSSPAKGSLSAEGSSPAEGFLPAEGSNTANLDDYISDFDDDQFDMDGFADSFKELEEKVASITEPGHLHKFEQSESNNVHLKQLKSQLQKKLAQKIETRIDELKSDLLNSIESEINELFKNLSKK